MSGRILMIRREIQVMLAYRWFYRLGDQHEALSLCLGAAKSAVHLIWRSINLAVDNEWPICRKFDCDSAARQRHADRVADRNLVVKRN